MAMAGKSPFAAAATTLLFLAALLFPSPQLAEAQIGVCYGKYAGENLPSPQDVVNLYKQYNIRAMRIYDLDLDILNALQGSGIKTILQVPNDNLQSVGTNYDAATQFVRTYVVPYAPSIKYIAVGNEVVTRKLESAQFVGPAMQNVLNALNAAGLGGYGIKVTTAIGTSLVVNAYPPSNGQFSNTSFMNPVVDFLVANGSPLLLNIYTYFSFDQDLNYRLFTSPSAVFTDTNNGLQYQNLFDALMDATYAALSKAGSSSLTNGAGSQVNIVVGQTGWKSKPRQRPPHVIVGQTGWKSKPRAPPPRASEYSNGKNGASPENAQTYYSNMINIAKGQTGWKSKPRQRPPHVVGSQTGWKSKPGAPPLHASEYSNGKNAASPENAQTYYSNLLNIVVGQTGWKSKPRPPPLHVSEYSDGENGASPENAQTYYSNLINHVKGGTPLKPGQPIEMYLFEMFDQYFGLFTADKTPKYNLNFS